MSVRPSVCCKLFANYENCGSTNERVAYDAPRRCFFEAISHLEKKFMYKSVSLSIALWFKTRWFCNIKFHTFPRAREWANERTDERVAQYFSLYSWLLSTIVWRFLDFLHYRFCLVVMLSPMNIKPWLHYGSKQCEIETLNYTLSHERGSERSERASERVSAAEGASEASSPEQASEWAVRANERTDERVAQYFSLYSWLLSTIVRRRSIMNY